MHFLRRKITSSCKRTDKIYSEKKKIARKLVRTPLTIFAIHILDQKSSKYIGSIINTNNIPSRLSKPISSLPNTAESRGLKKAASKVSHSFPAIFSFLSFFSSPPSFKPSYRVRFKANNKSRPTERGIFDKEEIDPPSVSAFFPPVLRILLFRGRVPRAPGGPAVNSMGGLISDVHAFHGPLIYYGRSNKQIMSRPVIHGSIAEMTSARFHQFPRNHAEYHFLPKGGQWEAGSLKKKKENNTVRR